MTLLMNRIDRSAVAALAARAGVTEYCLLSVFPGRW
jgi:hypothetical protein